MCLHVTVLPRTLTPPRNLAPQPPGAASRLRLCNRLDPLVNAQTPVTSLCRHLLLESDSVVLLMSRCTRVTLKIGLTH